MQTLISNDNYSDNDSNINYISMMQAAKKSVDYSSIINTEALQQTATSFLQSCDGITNLDNLISDTTGIGNSDTQRLSNKPVPSSGFDGLAYILGNLISKYSGVLDEPLHLSYVN